MTTLPPPFPVPAKDDVWQDRATREQVAVLAIGPLLTPPNVGMQLVTFYSPVLTYAVSREVDDFLKLYDRVERVEKPKPHPPTRDWYVYGREAPDEEAILLARFLTPREAEDYAELARQSGRTDVEVRHIPATKAEGGK